MYNSKEESIFDASRRTVERMAKKIPHLDADTRVIDLGAGYGGSARYLAEKYGCHVSCVNLSKVQNDRNRKSNKEYIERTKKGLHHWIENGKKGNLIWAVMVFRKV